MRFVWLLRALAGAAMILFAAPVRADTYDIDLTSELQQTSFNTGIGLTGITFGVVSPFFTIQAGDTVNFGTVALDAFMSNDQEYYYSQLGAVIVSNTPFPAGTIQIFGGNGGEIGEECELFLDPNCYASVAAAVAAYVPQPQSLIFSASVDEGIQLAFIGEYTYLSPTPIPATLPLFAGGLGAVGLFGWRRRRRAINKRRH